MFRRGAPIAIAIAAFLLLASQAFAGSQPDPRPGDKQLGTKGGIAYVSDTVTSSNPVYTESDATCPKLDKGWRIAGGGFRVGDKAGSLSASRPLDIYLSFGDDDLDPDEFWEASGDLALGKKLSSFAICIKEPKLHYVRADTPDGDSAPRSATDSCPGRTRPTGGGGFIATSNSYITSLFPKGRSKWSVGLYDAIGGIGGMTSDFVCLKAKPKRAAKEATVPAAKTKAVKATCPSDSHVTGGGARFSGDPGDAKLLGSYPVDGKDADHVPDDGWKAQGHNDTVGPLQLKAYAICRG
jgi:hypothetical protein